jgi:hypothetical protein
MRLIPTHRTPALLLASAITLCAASALAAEPAPAPAPTPAPAATPGAVAPGVAPSPAPGGPGATPAPEASPVATPSTEPAPPAPEVAPVTPVEETFPAAWFRIDSDLGGVQLWAGATHMLSDTVGIATDMYVNASGVVGLSPLLGEFDLGPAIAVGAGLTLTPMLGLQVDWQNHRAAALVPQLYLTGGTDPIYMELWVQNYEYGAFDKKGNSSTGGGNTIYTRLFVDYKVGKYFAVGPEVELTLALNSKSKVGDKSLTSLPVGLNFMLPNYGKGNNFFIFGGYETQDTGNDKKLAGRLTFVRNF